ncbi:hypothetical protein IU438_16770 [Nocardia cyriacigeorgica]|uniref:hypothetical protein n=1 Tax=Nocardia cyriacigeorgica TaxID=135487 RepID=UPI0018958C9D|nr:hypothetical protein [Nocardia cyriacigeorgica]MBF6397441.1 hypothetical protein [Nocardia cyriacigeorgica]MBF6402901.1 hypothetical protein [Nocardia cyriacigeorgica]
MSAPDEIDSETVRRIRTFTHRDVRAWEQIADGIRIGAALAADYGRMSAGFTWMSTGARAPLAAPYEEVWILAAGTMRFDSADGIAVARPGDLIHLHPASRGEFRVAEDLTMLALAYPPLWDIELGTWELARAQSVAGPFARVLSVRHGAHPRHTTDGLFTTTEEGQHFGMGFGRPAARGADDEFDIANDQVLVATRGRFRIRGAGPDGGTSTVEHGEFAYLPAGSRGTLSAEPGSAIAWAHLRRPARTGQR